MALGRYSSCMSIIIVHEPFRDLELSFDCEDNDPFVIAALGFNVYKYCTLLHCLSAEITSEIDKEILQKLQGTI